MKRMLVLLLAIAMLLSIPSASLASNASTPVKTTLIYGMSSEPKGLDPHNMADMNAFSVTYALYDYLVEPDGNGGYKPSLAETLDVSDDGLVYTFTIRENVKFHDGSTLTPADVLFSLNRTITEDWAYDMTRYIANVALNESNQIVITLSEAFNGILGSLACPFFAIMSEAYVSAIDNAENKRAPMGTGAYKLKEWINGQQIVLEAFEDYFQGAPAIKTITLKPVPDKNAAFIALESGQIDAYRDVNPADIPSIQSNDNLSLYSTPAASVLTLSLNSAVAPLNDPKLRQAIAHAINRDDIIIAALEGDAAAANSNIPPALDGYNPDSVQLSFDVELAKQLLAESAYPDGLTLTLKLSENNTYQKVAQILQANLKQIGIDVVIDIMEGGAFSSDIYEKSNFELSISSWSAMFLDAYSLMFCQYHSESFTFIGNTAQIKDPALDALLNAAAIASADDKVASYELCTQYIADEALMLPLAFTNATITTNAALQGITPNALGLYYFKDLSW